MITVTRVSDRAERRRFIGYPYRLYRGHSNWIPPLRLQERARFAPNNPFFEHADIALFLARDERRLVGRIAAIDDRLHNEAHHDNLASFGHFEAESEAASRALFDAAEQWARDRGRARMRGPLNSSLNECAGLLIDAFGDDPVVMMPYNPPQYATYLERAGYAKVKDLFAWLIELPGEAQSDRWLSAAAWFRKRHNITIRSANLSDFEREIERFVDVYCRAWSDNWGFVKPTAAESRQLASELKHVVDIDLVLAAEIGGRLVGCAIALPDFNQVFKGTNGRLFPTGLARLLLRKRIVTQVRLLLYGVVPEWRGKALAVPLVVEILSRASQRYRRAELSWILEDNRDTNGPVASLGGRHYKTYRLYEKALR